MNRWIYSISIVCLLGFSLMAVLISKHVVLQFDMNIISFVQSWEHPMLTVVMKCFTFIGWGYPTVVLAFIVMFFLYKVLHHRSELIFFVIVLAGSTMLNGMLKQLFQRARPDWNRLVEIGGYSFPSGHAMTAMAVYGALAFLLWRHISTRFGRNLLLFLSTIIIIMIGISRVYLGVHYPSDIIAGYSVSGFWLTMNIWLYQRYREKYYESRRKRRMH